MGARPQGRCGAVGHRGDRQVTYTTWDAIFYWIGPSFLFVVIIEWAYQRWLRKHRPDLVGLDWPG